jgi:hypothetical protein
MTTFVIRVWEPAEPGSGTAVRLRGVLEEIGSQRRMVFVGEDQLVKLIRELTREPRAEGPDA